MPTRTLKTAFVCINCNHASGSWPWTKTCPLFVGGWKHQKESLQVTFDMGRGVPPEETVCAGCKGQLIGPGVAHQATAANCQCQHPCQPQVSKAGVYELCQKSAAASECLLKNKTNQVASLYMTALFFIGTIKRLDCGDWILELKRYKHVFVLDQVASNVIVAMPSSCHV